jgi:hypothetical protein
VIVADFIFIVVLFAFFGLAAGLVKACDWIIGPDDVALAERFSDDNDAPTEKPA